jgi:hypothetical protein
LSDEDYKSTATSPSLATPPEESLLQDPELIFKKVWDRLQEKMVRENMAFPKEIMFVEMSSSRPWYIL